MIPVCYIILPIKINHLGIKPIIHNLLILLYFLYFFYFKVLWAGFRITFL